MQKISIEFKQILSDKPGFLGFADITFPGFGEVKGFGIWKREGNLKFYSPAKVLKDGRLMNYITFEKGMAEKVRAEIEKVVDGALSPTEEDLLEFRTL